MNKIFSNKEEEINFLKKISEKERIKQYILELLEEAKNETRRDKKQRSK